MFKVIATIVAAVAALFMFAGVASADVISQSTSEESHQKTTNTGSSNSAADHMTNDGPGIVQADSPSTVWAVIKRIPRVDENGDAVLGANGRQIIDVVWGNVPVGSGVAPATIVHN